MHYAEKELLVFNAFKNILNLNSNINKITVSDIAKEAGIGKGTIYEYFKSKEEIIAKATLFHLYEYIDNISNKINSDTSFKESCYILFDSFTDNINNIYPYFKLLFSNLKCDELYSCLKDDFGLIDNLKKDMEVILSRIISIGIKENLIKSDDIDYQTFVIRTACSGIATSIYLNDKGSTENIELYKSYAYNSIIKSL